MIQKQVEGNVLQGQGKIRLWPCPYIVHVDTYTKCDIPRTAHYAQQVDTEYVPINTKIALSNLTLMEHIPTHTCTTQAMVELAGAQGFKAIKIAACDDAYCQSLAKHVRLAAHARGLAVAAELSLPILTFRNDASGRLAARDVLSDCVRTRVLLVCTHSRQADHLFAAADALGVSGSTLWILNQDSTLMSTRVPGAALGLKTQVPDTAARRDLIAFWQRLSPSPPGLQKVSQPNPQSKP